MIVDQSNGLPHTQEILLIPLLVIPIKIKISGEGIILYWLGYL